MVIGPTPLETGRRATFVMELPHHVSTLHELSFEGEVKWAKPAPATDYYHSGIRFLSISDENLAVVEKLSLQFQRKAFGLDLHEEMNPSGIEPC